MTSQRPVRVLELRSVRGTGGGPEKTILFGAAAAAPGFEITVCYIRDQRDGVFQLGTRAARLGIEYIEVNERHSFDTGIWRQLRDIVARRRIDIVHAHEYKTDLLALLLAARAGVIPMATAHGWTGHSARERRVYYPLDKRMLARFPAVIAVSSQIRDELVRHGAHAERITVVLNSIDPAAFRRSPERRASVRAALGLAPGEVAIGAVGRAEPQKRFDLLLDAFAALSREHAGLRLVIAGDGSQLPALEAQARRLDLGRQCLLLGHRDDIADLHQAFDLFVQSSEYEGTPNAVLEAMAMETPLVATDAGGTRELAADGVHGLIVPTRDAGALRQAIASVLHDPGSAAARAQAARCRVERELSFEARTRRLEAVYADLARRRDHVHA